MQVINQSFSFGPLTGSGPQVITQTVSFPSPVSQATAFLSGFRAQYQQGHDRPMGRLEIQVTVQNVSGTDVLLNLQLGLRDWSGNWDDPYEGEISVSVIGE